MFDFVRFNFRGSGTFGLAPGCVTFFFAFGSMAEERMSLAWRAWEAHRASLPMMGLTYGTACVLLT